MAIQEHSLLADLALRVARSPEDVETEGLAYVLGRSEAARAMIQRVASEWVPAPLRPIAPFRSQVAAGDDSRPDLEAHDAAGIPVVVFENKFWAGLTPAQPVAYLPRLAGHGGALCFVAPTARLRLLWLELTERAATAFATVRIMRDESELKVAYVHAVRLHLRGGLEARSAVPRRARRARRRLADAVARDIDSRLSAHAATLAAWLAAIPRRLGSREPSTGA